MSEREILSVLLADPRETLSTLVTKSERLFRINKHTGDTILLSPRSQFLDRHLLAIYLLGRYFASKLGLAKDDELTMEELQTISGLDPGSLSARLSDLKREHIESTTEVSTVSLHFWMKRSRASVEILQSLNENYVRRLPVTSG